MVGVSCDVNSKKAKGRKNFRAKEKTDDLRKSQLNATISVGEEVELENLSNVTDFDIIAELPSPCFCFCLIM